MIAESAAAGIAFVFCLIGLGSGFLGGWVFKEWRDGRDL